jgi:glycosyltransferase domain-containing protein
MSSIEKFTIIIPTHNRPDYLRRVLDYYSSYKAGYNIIVADSSSDENKRRNKETISSLPDLKILYFGHYPSEIKYGHKFADALDHVETKYCLFCADDDFVVPNGIEESIDFLEKNEDFVVAHGQTITFYPRIKKEGEEKFYWQLEYRVKSNTLTDARSRLVEHLASYSVSTFYGVHRADFLKMIFRETLRSVEHGRFIELLLTELTLVYGKMKCLDGLYAAREIILDSTGIVNESINGLIKKKAYEEKYIGFRKCLVFHLSKNSDLSIEGSCRVVDDAMSAHLKRFRPGPCKQFLMDALDHLPGTVSGKIELIYRTMKLKLSKPKGDLLNFIKDPSSAYHGDFIKIRDCVLSHKEAYKK